MGWGGASITNPGTWFQNKAAPLCHGDLRGFQEQNRATLLRGLGGVQGKGGVEWSGVGNGGVGAVR